VETAGSIGTLGCWLLAADVLLLLGFMYLKLDVKLPVFEHNFESNLFGSLILFSVIAVFLF